MLYNFINNINQQTINNSTSIFSNECSFNNKFVILLNKIYKSKILKL